MSYKNLVLAIASGNNADAKKIFEGIMRENQEQALAVCEEIIGKSLLEATVNTLNHRTYHYNDGKHNHEVHVGPGVNGVDSYADVRKDGARVHLHRGTSNIANTHKYAHEYLISKGATQHDMDNQAKAKSRGWLNKKTGSHGAKRK